jgi:hypothetical protein
LATNNRLKKQLLLSTCDVRIHVSKCAPKCAHRPLCNIKLTQSVLQAAAAKTVQDDAAAVKKKKVRVMSVSHFHHQFHRYVSPPAH